MMADPVDSNAKARPEHRWPATVATMLALALYAVLPSDGHLIPPWIVAIVGALALVPQIVVNPHRLNRETAWSRWFSIAFAAALALINQLYVVQTIIQLVDGQAKGGAVLLTALQVWLTNVIAFSLVYWELDTGGPIARRTEGLRDDATVDFLFPQQANSTGASIWRPGFVDYAYFSLSTMMAFSPTDVMPLTSRAKLIMGVEAFTGFVLLALVISRGVNILS